MQNSAFSVWQDISGSGALAAIYVCALIFLFFQEKEKFKRILLIYLPVLWIGVLFLPITYRIIAEVIDAELYYRFFWMLPMTLTIAYALVQVYSLYQGKYKSLVAVGMAAVLALCGDFVYNNWRYSVAENEYHVPQSIVDICDFMHAEGREVMAVFPMDMLQYVRQYDSTVVMPYGRNVLVADWNINHPLCDVMEAEVLDGKLLGESAVDYNCMYIVVEAEHKVAGDLVADLKMHGYQLKSEMYGYQIFYHDELFNAIYK